MTEKLSVMKINEEQLEQVNGGYSKEESIKAIDDLLKIILGPASWQWEDFIKKQAEGK